MTAPRRTHLVERLIGYAGFFRLFRYRLQFTRHDGIYHHLKVFWIASSALPPRNDDECVIVIIQAAQALYTTQAVIATARNAAGSNPYLSSPEGFLDCFVGVAASQ
jgi:hypothetical protein